MILACIDCDFALLVDFVTAHDPYLSSMRQLILKYSNGLISGSCSLAGGTASGHGPVSTYDLLHLSPVFRRCIRKACLEMNHGLLLPAEAEITAAGLVSRFPGGWVHFDGCLSVLRRLGKLILAIKLFGRS